MPAKLVPRDVATAIERLEQEPGRAWTIAALAKLSGVATRTLQKHFHRFVDRSPLEYLRDLRLERARHDLLRAPDASVTEIANKYGFAHLGRFAEQYRERYGETPSATLRMRESSIPDKPARAPFVSVVVERPAVAVLPFEFSGTEACYATGIADEISASLLKLGWLRIAAENSARYLLRGVVRGDGKGRLRATLTLLDASNGLYLWADRWEGDAQEGFGFEDRIALGVTRTIEPALREAEVARVSRKDPASLTAWELTVRALPMVLSYERAGQRVALELLERAMDAAPQDPLPLALAARCRSVRGSLRFTDRPSEEQDVARLLAARAAALNTADALSETCLGAGFSLARDLAAAEVHLDRALALNGGSAWAWSRSGWINIYRGEAQKAIERFQIARMLSATDPTDYLTCLGIACAHLAEGRYAEAIRWAKRGLVQRTSAVWAKPFLAASYALLNLNHEARHTLSEWRRAFPEMTVAQIRSGLPFSEGFFNRVAEGLESAGLR